MPRSTVSILLPSLHRAMATAWRASTTAKLAGVPGCCMPRVSAPTLPQGLLAWRQRVIETSRQPLGPQTSTPWRERRLSAYALGEEDMAPPPPKAATRRDASHPNPSQSSTSSMETVPPEAVVDPAAAEAEMLAAPEALVDAAVPRLGHPRPRKPADQGMMEAAGDGATANGATNNAAASSSNGSNGATRLAGTQLQVPHMPLPELQAASSSSSSSRPRPRPRRSSSQSLATLDGDSSSTPRKKRTPKASTASSNTAAATANSAAAAAAVTGAAAAALPGKNVSSLAATATDAAAAAADAATAADALQLPMEPDMVLRNAFRSAASSVVLTQPCAELSAEASAWCEALGLSTDTLRQWGAGMTRVQHPLQQREVEVLSLPYYRAGRLVDVRHLQLQGGALVSSWLALGARQPYLREELLQGADTVTFVSCELEALLLSAAGEVAVALPRQAPMWAQDIVAGSSLSTSSATGAGLHPDPGQQQQQQQQAPLQANASSVSQPLPPLLQLLQLRATTARTRAGSLGGLEDPRLRLAGLTADLSARRRRHQVSSSGTTAAAPAAQRLDWPPDDGLAISDVGETPPTGLSLLAPNAGAAVLALEQGPVGEAVAAELAGLLGEVACRQMLWPQPTPWLAAALAAGPASPASPPGSSNGSGGGGDGSTSNSGSDNRGDGDGVALSTADPVAAAIAALPGESVPGWSVVLLQALCGQDAVLQALRAAFVWPIPGLERFSDHLLELSSYYRTPSSDSLALPTGWTCLDQYYKVSPGEVTLVSGVPNSGKSEWLDALAVNLALAHGWRFALCSMEKRPRDHARQLLEKIAGLPLLPAAYADGTRRMNPLQLREAYATLCEHFVVIAAGEGSMPSISWVLEKAKAAKIQHGIDGLIVDPYNELDPTRSSKLMEHEHVNEMMGLLRKFARENGVHCWLVAHPRQMASGWAGQRPGLQDISGGANFMNKADNGIIVHRDWSRMRELQQRAAVGRQGKQPGVADASRPSNGNGTNSGGGESGSGGSFAAGGAGSTAAAAAATEKEYEVQIIVEKVRNKTTGCKGECVLVYDRVSGRYHEPGQQPWRNSSTAEATAAGVEQQPAPAVLQTHAAVAPQQQHQQQHQQQQQDLSELPEERPEKLEQLPQEEQQHSLQQQALEADTLGAPSVLVQPEAQQAAIVADAGRPDAASAATTQTQTKRRRRSSTRGAAASANVAASVSVDEEQSVLAANREAAMDAC